MDGIEPLGDDPWIVGFGLHALHVGGGTGFFVLLRQPHGDRLAAQRAHAHEHAPDVAADLLAVGEIILRAPAALDDAQALRLADDLYENRLDVGHVDVLLSQFTVFCAVRNEERDRDGVSHIIARMQPELPVKRPREGIHVGKARVIGRVDDPDPAAAELPGRLGEAVFADIFRRCQPQRRPEQPVGVPRGKQRRPRKIGQTDLLRFVLFDVVLHPLDREDLFLHTPQLLTRCMLPHRRNFLSTFLAVFIQDSPAAFCSPGRMENSAL